MGAGPLFWAAAGVAVALGLGVGGAWWWLGRRRAAAGGAAPAAAPRRSAAALRGSAGARRAQAQQGGKLGKAGGAFEQRNPMMLQRKAQGAGKA
jgi:hypothetical protein